MKKFLLSIFAVMLAVFSVQAEEYSYTLAKGDGTKFGNVTWGGVKWNISANNTSYCQWDGSTSKGYQFGSSKQSCKTLTLSTSGIEGTITKIVVNTSGASSINASLTVSVGGIQFGSSTKLTTSAKDYTFIGSASGEIKFSYTQTSSKAIYIKSVAVTYESAAGGEGGGETVTVAAPTFNPASGATFTDNLQVKISTATDGATIHYTLNDGAEQAGSSPVTVNITETTTIVAYAIKADCEDSEEITATYTKVTPVSIAEAREKCKAEGAQVVMDLSGAQVVGVGGSNVFVQKDGVGICLYKNNPTYKELTKIFDNISISSSFKFFLK